MNRSRFDTLLAEFLDGSLSAGAAREFDAILGESAELRERLADAAEIHRLLEQELRSESGRAEGVNAVMRAVGRVAESRAGSDTAFEVMS